MTALRRFLPLLGLVAACLLAATPARAAKPVVKVVRASADASVRVDKPKAKAGLVNRLRIDGKPTAAAFLRFKLTGLTGKVVRQATVWVYRTKAYPYKGLTARATNGRAWSEKTVSWNRRPGSSSATGTAVKASGRWVKVDVTKLVRQNATVELALTTAKRAGLLVASREAGKAHAPRLHLAVQSDPQPAFPIRTAFYSSGYPARWSSGSIQHPVSGQYDGGDVQTIRRHLAGLAYGGFGAALTAWAGPRTPSDDRDAELLKTTDDNGSPVHWAYETTAELGGNPSATKIAGLLSTLDATEGRDPAYLRVRGRPVIYVPVATTDRCAALDRWLTGNAKKKLYLVFQDIPDRATCTGTPSDWYHVDPTARTNRVGNSSYSISPGAFGSHSSSAALDRDLPDWNSAVRSMEAAKGARWHLVDSFNDWASGTAVEPATEWRSASGYGQYLDALHSSGVLRASTPANVLAVGDIACSVSEQKALGVTPSTCQEQATSDLAASLKPQAILGIGDLMHGQATKSDFDTLYAPSWGRLNSVMHPVPGNHEYCDNECNDPAAAFRAGYLAYFGAARAEPSGTPWYSFDIGGWHIVALDSECEDNGGCGTGSPQETWLRRDLAAHPAACTLAYWHRPRFTGGHEQEWPNVGALWDDLYAAGAELVLNGHQHQYERFLPQTPGRRVDESGGLTEIVAGTGGRSHIPPVTTRSNTVISNADTFGVLQLTLEPQSFSWRFVPAPGLGSFADSGSRDCH